NKQAGLQGRCQTNRQRNDPPKSGTQTILVERKRKPTEHERECRNEKHQEFDKRTGYRPHRFECAPMLDRGKPDYGLFPFLIAYAPLRAVASISRRSFCASLWFPTRFPMLRV